MTIEEYFGDWLKVIDRNILNKVLNTLSIEYKHKLLCPAQVNVFKAFELCNLHNVNCIMIFQDPYPQKGVATGIALGNNVNTSEENLSPSLKIIKEAAINYEIPHNSVIFDNSLEDWCKQGVLMLNSALTCEMNHIGSHIMIWRPFIASLLKNLSNYDTAKVYVLFGEQAKTFTPYINSRYNYVITTKHPAYYARTNSRMPSDIFNQINAIIKGINGKVINWYK